MREVQSPPVVAPPNSNGVEQRPLGNEEFGPQDPSASDSVLTPLEDFVPSIQNPLTSSQSFFLIDSSGKQRMPHQWAHLFMIVC